MKVNMRVSVRFFLGYDIVLEHTCVQVCHPFFGDR